jgi:hypothetical protein
MSSVIKSREQIFDIRLLERNRALGYYRDEEYEQWIKQLGDNKDNAQYLGANVFFPDKVGSGNSDNE